MLTTLDTSLRPKWDSKYHYITACYTFAIGLPTIWRFPYVCYESGGAAFLIIYLILTICVGLPVYQLELSLGQIMEMSSLRIWPHFSPKLSGFGLSSLSVALLCAIYYSVILTWTFHYLYVMIVDPPLFGDFDKQGSFNLFNQTILHKSRSVSVFDIESTNWGLLVTHVLTWTCLFLCGYRNPQSSKKLAIFMIVLPSFCIMVLMLHAISLSGADVGLKLLFIPKMQDFLRPRMWLNALLQVFLSSGTGLGMLINFASYSPPQNDFISDAVIIVAVNIAGSLVAAIVVFSFIGHSQNAADYTGAGLLFVLLPASLEGRQKPVAICLTAVFFIVFICLGFNSVLSLLNNVEISMVDFHLSKSKPIRNRVILFSILFLCGTFFLLPNGAYLLEIVDKNAGVLTLTTITVAELLLVTWFKSWESFVSTIQQVTGRRLRFNLFLLLKSLILIVGVGLIVNLLGFNSEVIVENNVDISESIGCQNDCHNRGVCDQSGDFCRCDIGFTGLDCGFEEFLETLACPEFCNQRGRCLHGFCVCDHAYMGETCRNLRYKRLNPWWTRMVQIMVAAGGLLPAVVMYFIPHTAHRLFRLDESKYELTQEWEFTTPMVCELTNTRALMNT